MPTSANALYGSPKREISVILPVLNEEKYLEDAVNAILAQEYDGKIEVILAIGPSQDKTLEIAQRLHINDSRVVIVENPTGRTAAGLNHAIAASQYSIIVRVDGHANIPNNYCQLVSEILESTGAVNVGGVMAAEGQSLFERAVARAMRSPLGVGASRFHTGGGAGGGYSGGSAANHGANFEGGGGGSYNIGTNQVNTQGINPGNGSVIITSLTPLCASSLVPVTVTVNPATLPTANNVTTSCGQPATINASGSGTI